MNLFERLHRLSMRPLDRRQFGALGAAIATSLIVAEEAPAAKRQHKNKNKNKRGRDETGNGSTSQGSNRQGRGRKRPCGGLTGRPCPRGYTCVDDPSDSCDPMNGGADCGGICVKAPITPNPCAAMLCIEGTECCPNCGGLCVPRGTICADKLCGGETCGPRVCPSGQFCCNPECGICSPHPHICPMIGCVPNEPQPCGKNICRAGEYCCNPSCGTCAPLDGACTQEVCLDPTEADDR